jgi:glutaredoxin-related protein
LNGLSGITFNKIEKRRSDLEHKINIQNNLAGFTQYLKVRDTRASMNAKKGRHGGL